MRLFAGVDGGQSSTIALIATENGRVIGSGRGGPCYQRTAVTQSLKEAYASASLDASTVQFTAVCCGFSGGPAGRLEELRGLLPTEHLSVVNDADIALIGAFSGGSGIVVIAGTGSICIGRNGRQASARAGGWGYIFGDEGGAFDIARQATRAALRFEEGWGPETTLHALLLEATDESTANDMLHRFYSEAWPRSRVAELARMVDNAAESGDPVAAAILAHSAQSLSTLAASVRANIFEGDEHVRVSYIGGVFRSRLLLNQFQRLVELSGCDCTRPDLSPAAGALLEAFQLGEISVTLTGMPDLK